MGCMLHLVLLSNEWDPRCHLCSVFAVLRLGSKRCPLLLDTGEHRVQRGTHFFETRGLESRGSIVCEKYVAQGPIRPPHCYGPLCDALNQWQHSVCRLRHYLRGWGNWGGSLKRKKASLTIDIKSWTLEQIWSGFLPFSRLEDTSLNMK